MRALLLPVLALIAAPALAQTVAPPAPKPLARADAKAQVVARFRQSDTNRDGAVTRAEFDGGLDKALASPPPGVPTPTAAQKAQIRAQAAAAFARSDANKDGKITEAEMTAGPMAMFDRADANKDGVLSPQEQAAAVQAMRARAGAPR